MIVKSYFYKVQIDNEVVGSNVVNIWIWQSALTAFKDASNHVRWAINHDNFFICELKRIK